MPITVAAKYYGHAKLFYQGGASNLLTQNALKFKAKYFRKGVRREKMKPSQFIGKRAKLKKVDGFPNLPDY